VGVDVLDVTLEHCLTRTEAMLERIGTQERRFRDRTELPGQLVLLRHLQVAVSFSEGRLFTRRDRARDRQSTLAARIAAAPDSAERSQQQTSLDEIIERYRQDMADDVRNLERVVGYCLETVAIGHGRDFDPFVRPFGRLARLLAEDTEVVFRPSMRSVAYRIEQPLNDWLRQAFLEETTGTPAPGSLGAQIDQLPITVNVDYPVTEEDDAFHHLLIGHELAHLALRRTDVPDYEDGPLRAGLARHALDANREALDSDGALGEEELIALTRRVESWLVELACDRLAARMVGPAYFLALFEQAILDKWQYARGDAYERYPAWSWRLGSLWERVEPDLPPPGHGQAADAARRVFEAFAAAIPHWEHLTETREGMIVTDALGRLDEVEEKLLADGAAVYAPATFADDLEIVFAKLTAGIAPAERVFARRNEVDGEPRPWRPQRKQPWSEPIDWRSILNGGYVRYLADSMRSAPDGRPAWRRRRRDRRAMSALLQGAVELSENHLEAAKLRSELRELELRPA
jgi:hypothetical protein